MVVRLELRRFSFRNQWKIKTHHIHNLKSRLLIFHLFSGQLDPLLSFLDGGSFGAGGGVSSSLLVGEERRAYTFICWPKPKPGRKRGKKKGRRDRDPQATASAHGDRWVWTAEII
eukprot:TRINITY_DN25561_c0_g1_i1.p1 TRINITY_DN25561_c0_g1~~TRINITY_DN25561_c0_g1_i1.p1  ORF type:complete len:115 (-),score=17.62 TRINITY_DN25561_c0_g1_i1:15-359(-)